jgi:hypothetical protein
MLSRSRWLVGWSNKITFTLAGVPKSSTPLLYLACRQCSAAGNREGYNFIRNQTLQHL